MLGLGEGTQPCPELASLSGLCLPLSRHQSQETWRRSPQSPGLLVRDFLAARETGIAPEVGVEWGGTLVGQTARPWAFAQVGGRMGGLLRCPCFKAANPGPHGQLWEIPLPPWAWLEAELAAGLGGALPFQTLGAGSVLAGR